jgi:ribosomal-protein-alanine N-acetyltransferase
MAEDRLQIRVRRMLLDDVEKVVELDKLSFPTPWSARTYRHEILNSERSLMLVVEPHHNVSATGANSRHWLKRLIWGEGTGTKPERNLIAYSGFWHIVDESHISTIAVHPDWRGHKLGDLLIWVMVREAIRRQAVRVTLEVRVSNEVAQNLYRKYGFEISGVRKGYYRDNGEDAYLMTAMPLDEDYMRMLISHGRELNHYLQVTARGLTVKV